MEGPPLGPGGEDITWPDQVAPRGRKASSTRKIKTQTSNLHLRLPVGFACIHQWTFPPGVKAGLLQNAMQRHGSSSPLVQRLCAYSLSSSLIYL